MGGKGKSTCLWFSSFVSEVHYYLGFVPCPDLGRHHWRHWVRPARHLAGQARSPGGHCIWKGVAFFTNVLCLLFYCIMYLVTYLVQNV